MSFNEKLKELRLRHNLSQENLSRKLNIATRTYIYYEKGEKYPSVELLIKMAHLFNVGICFLIGDHSETTQDCKCNKLETGQLVTEISNLFAGAELSDAEKDAVMEALQEAYQKARKDRGIYK